MDCTYIYTWRTYTSKTRWTHSRFPATMDSAFSSYIIFCLVHDRRTVGRAGERDKREMTCAFLGRPDATRNCIDESMLVFAKFQWISRRFSLGESIERMDDVSFSRCVSRCFCTNLRPARRAMQLGIINREKVILRAL